MGFDVSLIGFPDTEIAAFTENTVGLTDPDEAPDVPANVVSIPGDLWPLGKHRLLCGVKST